MKPGSVGQAPGIDASTGTGFRKSPRRPRPDMRGLKCLALANAEANRIHQLVWKLNNALGKGAQSGLGIILAVTSGWPHVKTTIEVRTTFDLLEASAEARTLPGPANTGRAARED